MRLLRSLLWCVILGALGIIALLFLVQNLHTERLVFFGLVSTLNFAVVMAGAAAFGFLLALLLIVPGRIATALYARSLDREVGQLERQVAQLAEQRDRLLDGRERLLVRYERLFADHNAVTAERDRMRAQLAAAAASRRSSASEEQTPAAAVARPPLELRERGSAGEVRAAPVRVAAVAVDPPLRTVADAPAPTSVSAAAGARGGRMLPPVAPDPPAAALPIAPDPPVPSMTIRHAPAVQAGSPGDPAAPRDPVRTGQVRKRVARYTAAAREQMRRWRSQAGRVRRSAGARYNDMRTTLLARARAVAASGWTPSSPMDRDAAPADTRASSASIASAHDEDGHESSTLKGEQPLWRPPE